jgi:hypothetical protein
VASPTWRGSVSETNTGEGSALPEPSSQFASAHWSSPSPSRLTGTTKGKVKAVILNLFERAFSEPSPYAERPTSEGGNQTGGYRLLPPPPPAGATMGPCTG